MTTLEKLNVTLKIFVHYRFKEHLTLERLFQLHEKTGVEFGEVTSILNKLQEDGFIEQVKIESSDTEREFTYYKIKFNGLVFNEQGGYVNQKIQDHLSRANQKVLVFLTWIIALGTAVAAVYYGLEVWKFFCQHH